jgi:hypothetical chaperone protein
MDAVGIDFGTTNSAVATCSAGALPRLAEFGLASGATTPSFRSILYFERTDDGALDVRAGPRAIERYLLADEPGRLVQSLKSFLAARDFTATSIFGETYRLETMIGLLLGELRREAEATLGPLRGTIVVGRPVAFVAARSADDDALAVARLRAAVRHAGLGEIELEYEPVAAAYHYERRLDHDELILIADFGGGTSDFCLLHVGPGRRARGASAILGTAGVGVAGDAFDGRIVRHVVAPRLGLGAKTTSAFGNPLQAPRWIYSHLERWHHLSFLRSARTLHILHDLVREASSPAPFTALLHLVRRNLGFELHRSVEATKRALSDARSAGLRLSEPPVEIAEEILRADFSSWIWVEIEAMAECVDALLRRASVNPSDVDRVFLTGGSSFVPAVRDLFARRFGEEKLRSGDELTSVATGLALRAAELASGNPA